jgi:hypothetical protein
VTMDVAVMVAMVVGMSHPKMLYYNITRVYRADGLKQPRGGGGRRGERHE